MDTGQRPGFPTTFALWDPDGSAPGAACPHPLCVHLLWGPVLLPPAQPEEDAQSLSVLAFYKPT